MTEKIYGIDGEEGILSTNFHSTTIKSKKYKYYFDKLTGFSVRFGETQKDNPDFSPFGPEIADIEISSGGKCKGGCGFCYKNNHIERPLKIMTLEKFKEIADFLPPTIGQIAFGIVGINDNPDFFNIMEYAKRRGIVPNYTTNGLDITVETAKRTAKICGSVAVSFNFKNKNITYEAIKKFSDQGVKQVNMHFVLAAETFKYVEEVFDDIKAGKVSGLNAIVFLSLKKKGGGGNYNSVAREQFESLVNSYLKEKISFGFDSCGSNKFVSVIKDIKRYKYLEDLAEPCESFCFSTYINVEGRVFPCSFLEGESGWEEGIEIRDFWGSDKAREFRKKLIENGRNCPVFKI